MVKHTNTGRAKGVLDALLRDGLMTTAVADTASTTDKQPGRKQPRVARPDELLTAQPPKAPAADAPSEAPSKRGTLELGKVQGT